MSFEQMKSRLVGLFLCFVAVFFVGCGSKSPDLTAKILEITGKVELKQQPTGDFVVASKDDLLACGGALRTGDGASAKLEIVGKGTVDLKSDAYFELESGRDYALQKSGAAVYKIEKGKDGFKVKSPQGITCVLGTEFLVRVLEKMCIVGVEEGTVSFTTNGGEVRVMKAKEKVIADSKGFVGDKFGFDLKSDSFNYLQIDGKWVPKEAIEKK